MPLTHATVVSLKLAALDAAVALIALLAQAVMRRWRKRDSAITMRTTAIAGTVLVGACVVKLVVLDHRGWDHFGVLNAVYAEMVFGLPLLSAGLLIAAFPWRRGQPFLRATRPSLAIAVLGLLAAAVGVYASFIEPYRLIVETATLPLPDGRSGSAPVRIGVISDFQTPRVTDHERAAARMLMEQRPDIILLAGDVCETYHAERERQIPAFRELHASMSAPAGVYCVLGNLDYMSWMKRVVEGTGVRLLYNEIITVDLKDRRLLIAGLSGAYLGLVEEAVMRRLEQTGGPGDIRIILSHRPDAVLHLPPQSNVDLVVSGHTHGGQVRLPWIGALAESSAIPRWAAGGGLFEINGHPIYVNRGVGMERGAAPQVRFLCPPTVSIINLTGPDKRTEATAETRPAE